jgi:hypothetical protein
VQPVPYGIRVAEDSRRGVVGRATRRYPSPEGVDQDGVFVGGNSSSRRSTSDLIFAMT